MAAGRAILLEIIGQLHAPERMGSRTTASKPRNQVPNPRAERNKRGRSQDSGVKCQASECAHIINGPIVCGLCPGRNEYVDWRHDSRLPRTLKFLGIGCCTAQHEEEHGLDTGSAVACRGEKLPAR